VIDDAFIAFRYAQNLAEHGALTWNVGQDPVEGFTSFLWVVLNAGAIAVGGSPLLFSKGLSIACVLLIVGALLWKGMDRPWYLHLGVPAAVALSPAFAVLTVQGLETMGAALLVLATSAASVRVLTSPTRRTAALWYGCAFGAGLTRPDTLVFSAGMFAVLVPQLYTTDRSALRTVLTASLPFLLLGIGYMAWRVWYFGYLLPNPAYLKGDSMGGGIKYTATFFSSVLAPYLIVGAIACARAPKARLLEVLPTVVGAGGFALYLVNVEPIQGFLWRYAVPVFPALLYAILHLPWPVAPAHRAGRVGLWALGLMLVLFPLHTYPEAKTNVDARPAHDRAAVGTALQGLNGRLYTSESGALAYYSEWVVLDYLGLNSEAVAHGTPRRKALRAFAPDVIGLLTKGPTIVPSRRRWRPTLPYIQANDFVAVAATQKVADRHHLYFVDPSSPLCDAVVPRLRSIASVSYTPVASFVPDSLHVRTVPPSEERVADAVCRSGSVE
jgi:hypothetical protein